MKRGTLLVRRHGHRRRGYRRKDGVFTHPAQVPGVIFRIRDRGLPGRGPKVMPQLRKGVMTSLATKLGYINEGQTISDIPKSKMDNFGRDLVIVVGPRKAMGMVNPLIVLRKNERSDFKDKMVIAKDAIRKQSKVLKVHR